LVGKTSLNYESTTGHILRNDGFLNVTRSSGNAADFNRLSSDGEVVRISKDGTTLGGFHATDGTIDVRRDSGTNGLMLKFSQPTHGVVGAIGNTSVDFYITNNYSGSTDRAGIKLSNNNKVIPMENDASSDNVTDLGSTTSRWKDLYLGGGLYVGGTGTANKLDDYEEGTWTPSVSSGTITTNGCSYIKVGNKVTIWGHLDNFSDYATSTSVTIGGLPFTANNSHDDFATGSVMINYCTNTNISSSYINASDTINFYGVNSGAHSVLQHQNLGGGSQIHFNATYFTN